MPKRKNVVVTDDSTNEPPAKKVANAENIDYVSDESASASSATQSTTPARSQPVSAPASPSASSSTAAANASSSSTPQPSQEEIATTTRRLSQLEEQKEEQLQVEVAHVRKSHVCENPLRCMFEGLARKFCCLERWEVMFNMLMGLVTVGQVETVIKVLSDCKAHESYKKLVLEAMEKNKVGRCVLFHMASHSWMQGVQEENAEAQKQQLDILKTLFEHSSWLDVMQGQDVQQNHPLSCVSLLAASPIADDKFEPLIDVVLDFSQVDISEPRDKMTHELVLLSKNRVDVIKYLFAKGLCPFSFQSICVACSDPEIAIGTFEFAVENSRFDGHFEEAVAVLEMEDEDEDTRSDLLAILKNHPKKSLLSLVKTLHPHHTARGEECAICYTKFKCGHKVEKIFRRIVRCEN